MFAFGRFYYAELREMISYIRDYVSTVFNLIWIAYIADQAVVKPAVVNRNVSSNINTGNPYSICV